MDASEATVQTASGFSVVATILVYAVVVPIALQWFYTFGKWNHILQSLWRTRFFTAVPHVERNEGSIARGEEPLVTIQICVHNEFRVVEDTIQAACGVDWPKDKLLIEILDDSTDEETIHLIESVVSCCKAKYGVNVIRKSRPNREGYKAGNLNYHFNEVQGEFIAHFDADHRCEPDFLRKIIPFFYNQDGSSNDKIGLVQSPWAFYNTHQNLLTECDALGLDIHHVCEQNARFHANGVFGFNGTGGVWRKSAIKAAGGWSWDTVTEDLGISYKTHVKGYDFVYLREVPQLLELPSCILSHLQQKGRWTKGHLQVFRKTYKDILTSNVKTGVKLEALIHMTGSINYPLTIVMIILQPALSYFDCLSERILFLMIFPSIAPVVQSFIALCFKTPGSNGHYGSFQTKMLRLLLIPVYQCYWLGMSVFETKAVIEGIFSDDATFHTTPKTGSSGAKGFKETTRVRKALRSVKRHLRKHGDTVVAWLGLGLALYRLSFYVLFESMVDQVSWLGLWMRLLSIGTSFGLFVIHTTALKELGYLERRQHKGAERARQCRPIRYGRWTYFLTLGCALAASLQTVRLVSLLEPYTEDRGHVITKNDHLVPSNLRWQNKSLSFDEGSWSCPAKIATSGARAQAAIPLVILANERTGSNLLFERMSRLSTPQQEIVELFELFRVDNDDPEDKICKRLQEFFDGSCSPAAKDEWTKAIQQKVQQRKRDPAGLIHFMSRVPVTSKKTYVAFKVFNSHLTRMGLSPEEFIDLVLHATNGRAKFVVLWRQRMLEGFVSREIALQRKTWIRQSTTEADAINVAKKRLYKYIETMRKYYIAIRDKLDALGVDYEIIEYGEDLQIEETQEGALRRMWNFLDFPIFASQTLDEGDSLKKQAQVPLHKMVKNWGDVSKWGFGGERNQWENLFSGRKEGLE